MSEKTALVLLAEGAEEIETVVVVDVLRRSNVSFGHICDTFVKYNCYWQEKERSRLYSLRNIYMYIYIILMIPQFHITMI